MGQPPAPRELGSKKMTDAETMKEFRETYSFTQAEAANKLGYTDSRVIRRIEAGSQQLSGPAKKAIEYYFYYANYQAR